MHWVIQENLYNESGYKDLLRALDVLGLPHSSHKIIPFVQELAPDINPVGKVIAIGAYTMIKIAKERNWNPGVYANDNFDFDIQCKYWGNDLLNVTAWMGKLKDIPKLYKPSFIRPIDDSKVFSGSVMAYSNLLDWKNRIEQLGNEGKVTLDTQVLIAPLQTIYREYRTWIVNSEVVTASLYKEGETVRYDSLVSEEVIAYAAKMAKQWSPDKAYVLDIAETPHGLKILETNCINSAGFYAGNVGKIVAALEELNLNITHNANLSAIS